MEDVVKLLTENFTYDRSIGKFYHKKKSGRGVVGALAGARTSSGGRGQWYLSNSGHVVTLSRAVWAMETGSLPAHPLRFIDGDCNNTRFDNLVETCAHKEAVAAKRKQGETKLMPTLDRLNFLFYYDPVAGCLVNKVDRGVSKAGDTPAYLAARKCKHLIIDGVLYTEHRVIWYMVMGAEASLIDHIDRDPTNNRIENLRLATQTQNLANAKSRNKKFLPGVKVIKGREKQSRPYMAYIGAGGKQNYLGYFPTEEEAHEVHKQAHLARYGEFSKFYQSPSNPSWVDPVQPLTRKVEVSPCERL